MSEPSKRTDHFAIEVERTIDRSPEVTDQYIAGELAEFGQRAWALRARVVDMRALDVSFVVSVNMLDLLRKHGLDLGAGPGGMFVRGGGLAPDTLFGLVIYSDSGNDERHRSITLTLCDTGEHFRAAPVDMGKVRGVES
jgi:hypothetical protein